MFDDKPYAAKLAIALMDLTSLNDDDTPDNIAKLCQQASTITGNTAAVCIYPSFINQAKEALENTDIQIATVVNFPSGNGQIDMVVSQTNQVIEYGADEVDLVLPYRALMQGNKDTPKAMVEQVKAACGDDVLLKVIIESGVLEEKALIQKASEIAINAGADFIKTSTGKVPVNATLPAASAMLEVISVLNPDVGFKAAGGVRTLDDAISYMNLAAELLGSGYLNKQQFRFGASGLLTNLLWELGHETGAQHATY
ncbi:deoxyribose-phosphate aldolase [Thalassotalea mangrovi]|uniref:Deoxyribose-phosphate aldolase n=1 Tax=Thalassotalea mangrovi TaxID=2572245 RepID=A0A4U1B1S0_9GAMM|nr:deoxyribose-phosphate aldolase [Thalassotalea mangrovi]TKB43331.1 deoxyribose-phosphate aldolase [Thalassotalea mangrovi]